jgi:hypothetical protein
MRKHLGSKPCNLSKHQHWLNDTNIPGCYLL